MLPARARLFFAGVVAGGAAGLAAATLDFLRWTPVDVAVAAGLSAAIAVVQLLPMRFRHGRESSSFSFAEAVFAGALGLARPSVLAVSVGVGTVLCHAIRREGASGVAFHTGKVLIATTVAQAIYWTLAGAPVTSPQAWGPLAAAMAGFLSVNSLCTAAIISMETKRRFGSVFLPPLGLETVHWAGNVAIGILAALIWATSPLALPLLLIPILLTYAGYRAENGRLFSEMSARHKELEEIIANATDGIFAVSPEGRLLSWNPAIEEITGFRKEEVVGRPWNEVLGTSWNGKVGDGEGRVTRRDVHVIRKDRGLRWVRFTSAPIHERNGAVKAHVVVARDVTADLEVERLKGDLVVAVSHELRMPLTPLKGFLVALKQGTIDDSAESRAGYYRIMLNQANRLERLIEDLVAVAKIDSAKLDVDRQIIEVTGLAAEQVQEVAQPHLGRQISFRSQGVPVFARGDPFRVCQVLSNLVSNALDGSPPSADIEVRVTTVGHEAVVSVRDYGEGIPQAQQERVFDRVERLDDGLTARSGGTGLGLHIAKRLVEEMAGRIWVVSAPGQGSTFSFSLPLAESPVAGRDDGIRDVKAGALAATGTRTT